MTFGARSRLPGVVTLSPLHRVLRSQTKAHHVATERAFAVFDLRRLTHYRLFLSAQAAALGPLEGWLDGQHVDRLLPDWPERRRLLRIGADLDRLGAGLPPAAAPPPLEAAQALGVAYVLEGSRFGGRILAERVAEGDDPVMAEALDFLDQPWDAWRWPLLMAAIDREGGTPDRQDAMVGGAVAAFDYFRDHAEAAGAMLAAG